MTSAGYLLEEEKTMAFGRGIGDACFHNYVLDVTQDLSPIMANYVSVKTYLSFQIQIDSRGREVTKMYHSSRILPILDFSTDSKLNFVITKPVGKFVTAMSGLKTDKDFRGRSEHRCGK